AYDAALILFADPALLAAWTRELEAMIGDEQVAASVAGFSLRRLHDRSTWETNRVAAAFELRTNHREPQQAGQFLEGFLRGGSEVLLQDDALLHLLDQWLCALQEEQFVESLPLLRRSLSGFDSTARRRLMDKLKRDPHQPHASVRVVTTD